MRVAAIDSESGEKDKGKERLNPVQGLVHWYLPTAWRMLRYANMNTSRRS